MNTVIYRGKSSDYSITKQADGTWLVQTSVTAEGPDILSKIQKLIFADKEINLP